MLIQGSILTPFQKAQVLAAFIHRWTRENSRRTQGVQDLPSDEEWLANKAFYFNRYGNLDRRWRGFEPLDLNSRGRRSCRSSRECAPAEASDQVSSGGSAMSVSDEGCLTSNGADKEFAAGCTVHARAAILKAEAK